MTAPDVDLVELKSCWSASSTTLVVEGLGDPDLSTMKFIGCHYAAWANNISHKLRITTVIITIIIMRMHEGGSGSGEASGQRAPH